MAPNESCIDRCVGQVPPVGLLNAGAAAADPHLSATLRRAQAVHHLSPPTSPQVARIVFHSLVASSGRSAASLLGRP